MKTQNLELETFHKIKNDQCRFWLYEMRQNNNVGIVSDLIFKISFQK